MSPKSPERAALLFTSDLFFRAKIEALLSQAGFRVTSDGPAALAIIELASKDALQRIRALTRAGVPVIAFGSHVRADLLREARAAGAEAVPNSEIETVVRRALAE